ncbi:hypothetical protein N9M45_03665 [Euryarchaeota archaeon]|nr:hypothetical protein [Euryarchaeota archaeon]
MASSIIDGCPKRLDSSWRLVSTRGGIAMEVHTLNRKSVNQTLARRRIGTYFLGDFAPDGTFIVQYVGRSLTCIRDRLLHHASMTDYPAFQVHLWPSIMETFQMECLYYHHYHNQIHNKRHPDSPRSIPSECTYCKADRLDRRRRIAMDAEAAGVA